MSMIYLDYNATTPIDKSVADAMLPYIQGNYGNPSSSHDYGIAAQKAVESAREQVASLLNANPKEIVFTSGGSESNNMVIKGVAYSFRERGNHIITSQIEHPAVLNPCKFLEKNGYEVTYLPVDGFGTVNPEDLAKAITSRTILVTIMHANNETGTIQPISAISRICRKKGVLFHTDAAQTVGKIPTRIDDLGVDFLSVAGHKLYAPKGVGALYIRDGIQIEPLIHGAGHENGRRAGTENVIFNVGLGRACEIASDWITDNTIREHRDKFYKALQSLFGNRIRLNGHPKNRLPNTLYISFLGFETSEVMKALGRVAVSTSSACHSGSTSLSPVLRAMGISDSELAATIRFSLGRYTTDNELEIVLKNLSTLVEKSIDHTI
ncbi:MAG: cysteine desulfurase NifS [Deltaproteobacteria bacterium RBG_13_52_11]|nr:MAG: cysteine desulfurase NifS [Deltaproteobacteria bacterium RBG_13_52_11]